jgi:hypothetical protein
MGPSFDHVGPGYFSTVGIPVLRGRGVTPEDAGNAPRVGLINETMAHMYFGDTDPLGRTIPVNIPTGPNSATPYPFVIVGVAADSKYYSVRESPRPFYYVPMDNPVGVAHTGYLGAPFCIVRTTTDPAGLFADLRSAVQAAAPNAHPPVISTVDGMIGGTLGLDRALTGFSGFFGTMATILVSIGIYGIMAYAVARRTREIGIRIAIGAQHGHLVHRIVGESLVLVLAGVVIGIPAAIGAGRFVTSFLFGLTPADPLVLISATVLMFFVSALAAYVPARSATRIDPLVALRAE